MLTESNPGGARNRGLAGKIEAETAQAQAERR
jgi:hypothetical protein